MNNLSKNEKHALELASEKGASNWLNALPLSRYHLNLNKAEFQDGIYLRYGWEPTNIPLTCACGQSFDLTHTLHTLHCAKAEYIQMRRHNESRDTFAILMSEICFDVKIEPELQSLQGESCVSNSTTTHEDSRLDVKSNGLWGSMFSRTFLDVKVFNPHEKTSQRLLKDAYKYHDTKILIIPTESFTCRTEQLLPAHLPDSASTSGAASAATRTMQRIVENFGEKCHENYAKIKNYMRSKTSFKLLRSAILCIRGCRSQITKSTVKEYISTPISNLARGFGPVGHMKEEEAHQVLSILQEITKKNK